MRLSEELRDWLGRVELLARGAEGQRIEALRALAAGRPWEARQNALEILDQLPRSKIALALWADAAEATFLDNEVEEALERLAREAPYRADIWLRLAKARSRLGQPPTAALERAAESAEPIEAADTARLWLADRDLAEGDAARAERWLEQLSLGARNTPEAMLRRLELALDAGDLESARRAVKALSEPGATDARAWLLRGRFLSKTGQKAAPALRRALVLDAPGALRAVAEHVARSADLGDRETLKSAVEELDLADHPLIRAALAETEGRRDDALAALADGARGGDVGLIDRFVESALAAEDESRLREGVALAKSAGRPIDRGIEALLAALDVSGEARLDALDAATGPSTPWAEKLRAHVYADWCPSGLPPHWRELLAELRRLGRALVDLEALSEAESISRDLDRPLRVAIVGEFNAGKSTLINALLGEDVAPVGVLPTTATVNHLVWSADRFVRIERRDGAPDRVVSHADLKKTLREIDASAVERVTIYAPLELLRKIELIDTPGFNAPDAAHAEAARSVFRDAHVAFWLLDAAQPLKASERLVLVEIQRLGLPLFVLLNKIDRLPDEPALRAAIDHVETGLAEVSITPDAPLVAFSARLALDGQVETSRWALVERLVEDVLVGESARLRERALRRRAEEIALRLAAEADQQVRSVRDRQALVLTRRDRLARAGATLGAERRHLERRLEPRVHELVRGFLKEAAPVAGTVAEPGARRFVEQRARKTLGPPLAQAAALLLTDLDQVDGVAEALSPRVEALTAALAAELVESESPEDLERTLSSLVIDELERVLGELRDALRVESEPPLAARALALATALNAKAAGRVQMR